MRSFFSFPVVLGTALVVITLFTVRSRFHDPDTWWHLKTGQVIVETGTVPRTDLFSYTTNQHPWIAHEWLSQASLYGAYKLGGYRGLWMWLWGLASLLFVLLYVLCSLYSGNAKVSLLGGLIGWFFGTVGLALRPLIVGHLFLVVELLILELARARDRRWLWALPPLFAVWANCHGSYALGLLVLSIVAGCSFVELRAGRLVSVRRERDERRRLCVVLAMSAAALLANPAGARMLTYPINVFARQTQSLMAIREWAPLSVTDPRGVGLFLLVGGIGLILLLRPAELRLEEVLLMVLALGMALRHIRLLFAFGILIAPIVCRLLANAWERYDPARDWRAANAVMVAGLVVVLILGFPSRRLLEQQVEKEFPVGAVAYLRRTGLAGPMLNHYEWGGYLIWALPEQKVFIDGRGDIFDWTGVLSAYGRWMQLLEDPRKLPDRYGVRYCLLPKGAPVSVVLPLLPGWQQVYADERAVIVARSEPR